MRHALHQVMAAPNLGWARDTLLLTGTVVLEQDAYDSLAELADLAAASGYQEMP